ncbi:hypothetical protein [Cereibacter sphaeroides]|uniref:hypothetical protein n=1 Tax=Cereibacter sphaeroides TaxID=1063 RepID=UPI000F52B7C1|nr:hypothetical protein [Cereibacter sphaeroides]
MAEQRRLAVVMSAFAVAMKAKADRLQPGDVDQMRDLSIRILERGEGLRDAITAFAFAYGRHRRDPEALAFLGEDLLRAVQRDLRPEPIDLHRRDIHG